MKEDSFCNSRGLFFIKGKFGSSFYWGAFVTKEFLNIPPQIFCGVSFSTVQFRIHDFFFINSPIIRHIFLVINDSRCTNAPAEKEKKWETSENSVPESIKALLAT